MTDPTRSPSLSTLIDQRYSRRQALRGSAGAAAMTVFGGSLLAACGGKDDKKPTEPAPVVTASATPATATSGTRVTITASATDNGTVTGITYVQVSGPAVTLSSTTGATTSFIAPSVIAATIVVIRVTATDNTGTTGTTDVNINIGLATLSFTAVAKNRSDLVTIPAGYSLSVLYRTGDPLNATTAVYKNDGTDTDFATRAGDNGAGFVYFGLVATGTGIDVSNSARGLLVMNHEGITQAYLHPAGPTAPGGIRPEAEVAKETEAHGVSVVEVASTAGVFGVVPASTYNRRITPSTPVVFNGPARGNALLQTAFSTAGTDGRGTIGNSAAAITAWSTSLHSEEKWARYFRRPSLADDPRRTAKELRSLNRYGITSGTGLYGWATVTTGGTLYSRWDAQATGGGATGDFRNEPNQFGWVVEVDPYSTTSTIRKRTALGRLAHSGVVASIFTVGIKPAVYMGDNAPNEYLYKFVSNTAWASADAAAADRMAIGDKYLDTGTLYVAKFAADGTGTWLPMTFGTAGLDAANATYSFTDQADVLANARIAADILGATPLDKPDWIDLSPSTGQLYVALNGNDTRTAANANPANPRAYMDPPGATVGNRNGHILRLVEAVSPESTTFLWDAYLFGAGADLDPTNINVSALTADNDFSGPEGLRFSRPSNPGGLASPMLWVQTDDTAYRDVTNNQLLTALVGIRGDGADKVINNAGTNVTTKLGKAPGTALKRFLVGPVEAAVTGVDTTPDGRTLFVNIQHPGENGTAATPTSNWPANQTAAAPGVRPRSATVVITRTDGGIVGL